jgi:predicted nucleic acid-binding protein
LGERAAVTDAGPLIALARIGRLSLLRDVLGKVLVPEAVVSECVSDCSRPGAVAIQHALDSGLLLTRRVERTAELEALAQLLDRGEAEALTLGLSENIPVLMDEKRGRRVALHLGVPVVGTGAVLIAAKQAGLVEAVAPLLEELQDCGYRLADPLVGEILHRCGER